MKFRFLSDKENLQQRVFDIGLTLTLVGFLLNLQGLILVNLRLLGILLVVWVGVSKAVRWAWKDEVISVWIHVGAMIVHIILFIFLCMALLSEKDIDIILQR